MPRPARTADCHPDRRHEAHGLCRQCYSKGWIKNHRGEGGLRLYRYGITNEEFDQMREAQNHKCRICQKPESEMPKGFYIDHNHACCPGDRSCGKCVRGLLCQHCNTALGMVGDDVNVVTSMLTYLITNEKEVMENHG